MKVNDLKNKYSESARGKEPKSFSVMLQDFKPQIAAALPRHLNADRMIRIAMTEFRKNNALADCDITSIFASIITASQLGLEPGVMGQCYLIPYKGKCQLVPGWHGMIDLVARTGRAMAITGAVYENDRFDYELGSNPFVKHWPCGEDDPSKLTHVYAVGKINGINFRVIEVWPVSRVKKQRDKNNKVGSRHYSFSNFEMYARKLVLLQVIKYLPKSIELAAATNLSYSAENGNQIIDMAEVAKGNWETTVPTAESTEIKEDVKYNQHDEWLKSYDEPSPLLENKENDNEK